MAGWLDPLLSMGGTIGPSSFPSELNEQVEAARLAKKRRSQGFDMKLEEMVKPSIPAELAALNPQEILSATMAPGAGLAVRGAEFLAPAFVGATHGMKRLPRLFHGTDAEGNIPDIAREGFKRGASAELKTLGTSLSRDPLVSLDFAHLKPNSMLEVKPNVDPAKVRNLRPSEFTRGVVPEDPFFNKPNFFREKETFARRKGDFSTSFHFLKPDDPELAIDSLMEEAAEGGVQMTRAQAAKSLGLVPDVEVKRLADKERRRLKTLKVKVTAAANDLADIVAGRPTGIAGGGGPRRMNKLPEIAKTIRTLRGHALLTVAMNHAATALSVSRGKAAFMEGLARMAPQFRVLGDSVVASRVPDEIADAAWDIFRVSDDLEATNTLQRRLSEFINPSISSMGPQEALKAVTSMLDVGNTPYRLTPQARKLFEKIQAQLSMDMPEMGVKALTGSTDLSSEKMQVLFDDLLRMNNRNRADLADKLEDLERLQPSSARDRGVAPVDLRE